MSPIITLSADPVLHVDEDPFRRSERTDNEQPHERVRAPREAATLRMSLRDHVESTRQWLAPRERIPTVVSEPMRLSGELDERLVLVREPFSERARRYRLLRHGLVSHGDPRIIAVTSARAGEGKTTCALNLALATAEDAMTRTLLLDANLRRPSLSQILDFTPSRTIVDNMVEAAGMGPPYPVASVFGTGLQVAPLPAMPLPGARLDRVHFATLLGELREAFDYIIIDAASVFETGDVDVVAESSAALIMAARPGRSKKRDMRIAAAELAPARVMGAVLIDG